MSDRNENIRSVLWLGGNRYDKFRYTKGDGICYNRFVNKLIYFQTIAFAKGKVI